MRRMPDEPTRGSIAPPMVYVTERTIWEYKQVTHSSSEENIPTEKELNEFGKDGWELVSILTTAGSTHLYFKRPKA